MLGIHSVVEYGRNQENKHLVLFDFPISKPKTLFYQNDK